MQDADRIMRVLCASLLCTATAACSGAAEPSSVRLEGRLDNAAVAHVRQLLDDPRGKAVKWIEITSVGGSARAGMDLAELVRERKLGIRVREYCISACAQYPFMAARQREVLEGGLVLFHNSMSLNHALNTWAGKYTRSTRMEQLAAREGQYWLGRSTSELVSAGIRGLEPYCILDKPGYRDSELQNLPYVGRYKFYAMPREDVEAISDVPIGGYWPKDHAEAVAALGRLPLPQDRINWVRLSELEAEPAPLRLPDCPEPGTAS